MYQVMEFVVAGAPASELQEWLVAGIRAEMVRQGHHEVDADAPSPQLVLNLVDPERPRPFRRRAQGTFVVGLAEAWGDPEDVLRTAYPLMVRSLGNLFMYVARTDGRFRTFFITLERGYYEISHQEGDDAGYFATVYQRLAPLATSQLVINNRFDPDLPPELWDGTEATRQITWASRELDRLDLLPAPFPMDEFLSERELRHIKQLYGVGGLSYCNVSARHDERRFWMSASGVNKSDLRIIGQHILLVKDYEPETNAIVLSVPPGVEPHRVSVDAIEHWMIYTEHPQVGAVLHLHAWLPEAVSTDVNYPCGTRQLAQSVAELVRLAPDPGRAVIGLRNHGLTVTGPSLEEIFHRIEGRVLRQVPMS